MENPVMDQAFPPKTKVFHIYVNLPYDSLVTYQGTLVPSPSWPPNMSRVPGRSSDRNCSLKLRRPMGQKGCGLLGFMSICRMWEAECHTPTIWDGLYHWFILGFPTLSITCRCMNIYIYIIEIFIYVLIGTINDH